MAQRERLRDPLMLSAQAEADLTSRYARRPCPGAPAFGTLRVLHMALIRHLKRNASISLAEGRAPPFELEAWLEHAEARVGSGARRICETGFNTGHSAAAWLCSQPNARYIGFDLMRSHAPAAALAFLNTVFKGRISIVAGDSLQTLPAYVRRHQAGEFADTCDIISVDGGHKSYQARSDLINMHALAGPGNFLVMDDLKCSFSSCPMPTRVWGQEMLPQRLVVETNCSKAYESHAQGWCWGYFNVSTPARVGGYVYGRRLDDPTSKLLSFTSEISSLQLPETLAC